MHKTQGSPTFGEMFSEIVNLSAGVGILLLPLLATALPGVLLLLVAPAILLFAAAAVPVAIVAAVLALPYLMIRFVGRHLRRTPRDQPA